jgi:hypothetical protein
MENLVVRLDIQEMVDMELWADTQAAEDKEAWEVSMNRIIF